MLKILAILIVLILLLNLALVLFLLYHYFYLCPKWEREKKENPQEVLEPHKT